MILISLLAGLAHADPCGMVPPAWIPPDSDMVLERQGLQQTYAFYADGVQTLAIRPGFTGAVEEFGMLVPFPSAPAIRKVPDAIFPHLSASVDPPQVDVQFYQEQYYYEDYAYMGMAEAASEPAPMAAGAGAGMRLKRQEVRVINEEAVGMYEVAVLAAGSSKALSKWMDKNEFQYPAGMDDTVEDYVDAGWVFVAVKANIGAESGTSPRPGMRSVNPGLPAGASFDGYVQGMGFRFEVDAPVIPMRLSTFNGNDTHNRVYFLSEDPLRFERLSAELVKRQVDGEQLYENVAGKLPVSYTNGTEKDLPEHYRAQVEAQRSPAPYNGVARDLFASDLLALKTGRLALPFEESEKELLRISEGLQLRGTQVDALHEQVVSVERAEALDGALDGLADLTLNVIDGDFPKRVLADHNLTVARYAMPDSENSDTVWTERQPGPQVWVPLNAEPGRVFPIQMPDLDWGWR